MKGFIFFTEMIMLTIVFFTFLSALSFHQKPFLEDKYYVSSDILFLTDLNEILLAKNSTRIQNYLNNFDNEYEFLAQYYSSDFDNFLNISLGVEPSNYVQNKRVVYNKDNEEYMIMTIKLKVNS